MISRPLVFLIICFGLFILIQSFIPKAMAIQNPNGNEYTLEDQRARKRKNYAVRLHRNRKILGRTGNLYTNYETDYFRPDPLSPKEMSAFGDYANDLAFLDNFVESRAQKRGNIKVEKYNHALPDPPCSCEYSRKTTDFGANSYPRFVETRNCDTKHDQSCRAPYFCKENLYNVTILRRSESMTQESLELPNDLKYKWVAERHPISVGCLCISEYYVKN